MNNTATIENILNGTEKNFIIESDILNALQLLMVMVDMFEKIVLKNIVNYLINIPFSYSLPIILSILKNKNLKEILIRLPEWVEYAKINKQYIM